MTLSRMPATRVKVIVPDGDTRKIKDQKLELKGVLFVDGNLIIDNCMVKVHPEAKIVVNYGSLLMMNCKVESSVKDFIELRFSKPSVIKNTEFLLGEVEEMFNDSFIYAWNGVNLVVENCKFEMNPEVKNWRTYEKVPADKCCYFDSGILVNAISGRIKDSYFKGYPLITAASVSEIRDSSFEACGKIVCSGEDENMMTGCKLQDCHTVEAYDCIIEGCEFHDIKWSLDFYTSDISHCVFDGIRSDWEYAIYLEDSEVRECKFKNMKMTNQAYLMEAVGNVEVEECHFENYSTDRMDGQLFLCEKKCGLFLKEVKKVDFGDWDTCTGLKGK